MAFVAYTESRQAECCYAECRGLTYCAFVDVFYTLPKEPAHLGYKHSALIPEGSIQETLNDGEGSVQLTSAY